MTFHKNWRLPLQANKPLYILVHNYVKKYTYFPCRVLGYGSGKRKHMAEVCVPVAVNRRE